jgi:hypothetical protein
MSKTSRVGDGGVWQRRGINCCDGFPGQPSNNRAGLVAWPAPRTTRTTVRAHRYAARIATTIYRDGTCFVVLGILDYPVLRSSLQAAMCIILRS